MNLKNKMKKKFNKVLNPVQLKIIKKIKKMKTKKKQITNIINKTSHNKNFKRRNSQSKLLKILITFN